MTPAIPSDSASSSSAGTVRAAAADQAALPAIAVAAERIGMALLIAATWALLLRPADLIPWLADAPIYEDLIVACLFVSLPRVCHQIRAHSLQRNAIALLVLLLVPAVMLSHLSHADTYDARLGGVEMIKASALFLLITGIIDSVQRLKTLLFAMTAGVFVMTVLAVLQYHGALNMPALSSVVQGSPDPDNPGILVRLCGIGVFHDPNDLSMLLVMGMAQCAYVLGERRHGLARWAMLVPIGLFGYAVILTHSRGGLMALVTALLTFLGARFGWRNAMAVAALLVPALLVPAWGRQTSVDLDNPDDTFQSRIELWYTSFDLFKSAPFFGIGQDKLVDLIGKVTHNSYLHAFTEMGLFGGVVFTGAFHLALRGLRRAAPEEAELARLRPYVFAMTAAYAVGLLSLSRCYTVPTQLVLALATAYLAIASRHGRAALPRTNWRCVHRVITAGLVMLAATYLFVGIMLQRGGS